MKIAVASDHGGFQYKEIIKARLSNQGFEVKDFGCFNEESCDYPDFAFPCAKAVSRKECDLGIVICGTGIGVSIVANKVRGIRCALVLDEQTAAITREHNDSNMLAMGARILTQEGMEKIVDTWVHTKFSNEQRHLNRIDKIAKIELGEE